jgi:hypothetical protein
MAREQAQVTTGFLDALDEAHGQEQSQWQSEEEIET